MIKNNLPDNSKTLKAIRVLIFTALLLVIFYPPYLQGLFFEKDQLPTEIYVFFLFIIFLVYKGIKKEYIFLKTPIEFIAVSFVAVYLISIFTAVHTRSAIAEMLKYCMYFLVFYIVSDLADSFYNKILILRTIIASAIGVSIIGLDSAMGGKLVAFLNQLFNNLGVEGDLFFGLIVDGRINSTLQYPNALASYVMAAFFIIIGLILSEKKRWIKALYGVCSYILFLTFMLTQSRGAQLLFPVATLIFIVAVPKKTRIKSGFHVLFLAIPAILISFLILPHLSAEDLNQKALILFGAGILVTVLFTIIADYLGNLLQGINWRVYAGLTAVLVIVIPLIVTHVINATVPLELSHGIEEENSIKSISRNISLTPGEYILLFEAKVYASKEQPYNYNVSISSKTEKNIVFGGSTTLVSKSFRENSKTGQEEILFSVPDDSLMSTIYFTNYYSGTGVILDHAEIIDSTSRNTVQKIILKNKYNIESFIARFQNIEQEKSGIVRFIYYKDGMKILKDRWLLGGGGGAWEYLYRQYQSYNYSSSQAHNYPLQLGIETGIIGLLVLLGLIFVLVWGYLRYVKIAQDKNQSELFTIATVITAIAALFMHAIVDFDFSESAILLLFWQLIALFNREMRDSHIFEVRKTSKTKNSYIKRYAIIGYISITAACVVTLAVSISFYSATLSAKKAFRNIQQNKIEESISNITRAIRLDKFNEKYVLGYNPIPSRPDIKVGLADILFSKIDLIQQQMTNGNEPSQTEQLKLQQQFSEMHKLVLKLEKKAKNNLALSANLASFYLQMGNTEKGIEYLNHAIKLFPFEKSLWHSKVNLYFELTKTYYNNSDDRNAKKYLEEGLNIVQEAKEVNNSNMNPFEFDQKTIDILQVMKYIYDYYGKPELSKINEVIHYTLPNLDVNLDKVPDQWRSGDSELIDLTASEQGILIHVSGTGYIYSQQLLKLKKGKKYSFEIKASKDDNNLSCQIVDLEDNFTLQKVGSDRYYGELIVENEPNEQGNQFRIIANSDCIIESVKVMELVE